MSGAFQFVKQFSFFAVTCGAVLVPAGDSLAQFGRRTSSRSASSAPARDSEINRELAELYRRNGREMPETPEYDDEALEGRSGNYRIAKAEVPPASTQSKPGFLGRMFGRGRSSSGEEEGAEPRRRLFGSRSDRESEIYPPTHKKGDSKSSKKKDSELLDPRDLEPAPPRPLNPTGARRNTLSAPKSPREGTTRREPVGLQAPDRLPDSVTNPKPRPGVVPPPPDDPDSFFDESKDSSDRESLDLSGNEPRGVDRKSPRAQLALREPTPTPVPAPKPAPKPVPRATADDDLGLETGTDDNDEEVLDEPDDGDVPGAGRALTESTGAAADEVTEEPATGDTVAQDEPQFESAFDSPYRGASLPTREIESRRVEGANTPAARLRTATAPGGSRPAARPAAAPATGGAAPEQRTALKPVAPEEREVTTPRRPASAARRSTAAPSGLMGYCPVALKDKREMVPAQEEFSSQFSGRTYEFASEEAKAAFDANPRRYIPAMNGQDVVRLSKGERGVEGSLEHSAWFRSKLYLFSSEETLQQFVNSPSDFVAFP